jgi:hypothetical protein
MLASRLAVKVKVLAAVAANESERSAHHAAWEQSTRNKVSGGSFNYQSCRFIRDISCIRHLASPFLFFFQELRIHECAIRDCVISLTG